MEKQRYRKKKLIAQQRFKFFSNEVAFGFILIFIFMIISTLFLSLVFQQVSISYSITFYIIRVLIFLVVVPLTLAISTRVFSGSQKGKNFQDSYISPSKGHLLLYRMTKKNYKFQFLYGLLIFLLVLVPLNCLFFVFIPGMVVYQAISFSFTVTDYYLLEDNYILFLLSTIIIQTCISIANESISKGLIARRGSDYYSKRSAVIITSLFLGFSEFIFYFDILPIYLPPWFPLIWFLKSFLIGIILSLFILRKNWLFPIIFASIINNIFLTHVMWGYLHGVDIYLLSFFIYVPLLIIDGIILLWEYPRIKKIMQAGVKELKLYLKNDKDIKETSGDKSFRIFVDIIIGGLMYIISILIAV